MVTSASALLRSSFPEADREDFRTAVWRLDTQGKPFLPPIFPTLVHAFAHAAKKAEKVGVTLIPDHFSGTTDHQDEIFSSYSDLFERSLRYAAQLRRGGVKHGDRVVIVLPTCLEFPVSFFAVLLLGAVPVPAYPPVVLDRPTDALNRLSHIAQHCGAAWVICNAMLHPYVGGLALTCPQLKQFFITEELEQSRGILATLPEASGDDAALIQYTSGSTAKPKGVLLTHFHLVANIHAIGAACQVRRTDVGVSWLPLYHDMGLIGTMLFCFYWRLPLVLMPPTMFVARPEQWLWAIHRHRGTLSASPNFGFSRVAKKVDVAQLQSQGLDLSSWRLALNGAEIVSIKTIQTFESMLAPLELVSGTCQPVYGLAEATVAVTCARPGQSRAVETVSRAALAEGKVNAAAEGTSDSLSVISISAPLSGYALQIVDDHGTILGDRQVGHLEVRGPSVMQGYYRNPEATAQALRDGWLRTGDLGYRSDGNYFITGRAKDVMIVHGRKYHPEDVESACEHVSGVRAGCTVAFSYYDQELQSERVVVAVESRFARASERKALREVVAEAVAMRCELRLDDVLVVAPNTLPKTSSGKKQRALSRQRYLAGNLGKLSVRRSNAAVLRGFGEVGVRWSALRRMWAT